ncbi:MAG: cache domain-containing protein [Syntrophales bacterium]
MRRISFFVMLVASVCLFLVTSVSAQQRGTAWEAKKMVEKAIAYIKANGQEKAFVEINNPSGLFVDRDMYITVIDMNGKCLARGFNPELLGKDLTEMKDPDGKFFIKERIEMAKTKGSGWQNYKFTDPITKNVEPKTAYFEKYGDIIVMCGTYMPEK